jgi:hypothetical protein
VSEVRIVPFLSYLQIVGSVLVDFQDHKGLSITSTTLSILYVAFGPSDRRNPSRLD